MSKPALELRHVARTFVDGTRTLNVLSDVSLSAAPGEVVALVGRSGCGKSTLLHLAGLLDQPTSGDVLIDGTPAGTLAEAHRAALRNRRIGFVFQHFFLLPEFSVLENVLMPARMAGAAVLGADEAQRRARELLERVGLGERLNQKPATLSGGERQRVGLARALLLKPRVLLCDEPTGNLDPETAQQVAGMLLELGRVQQAAVLLVTHDTTLAERCDRILRLSAGRLSSEN